MEHSAASATGLLERRSRRWSRLLARAVSVDPAKLPALVAATDVAGSLTSEAARSLGLPPGIPVVAAGGDAIAATVGAGTRPMIQLGTSGWVAAVTDRRRRLPPAGVASLSWAEPGLDLDIAVSESVGPCLTWITRVLYDRDDGAAIELLEREVGDAPAAIDGMVFAPWLIGERSPFNDANVHRRAPQHRCGRRPACARPCRTGRHRAQRPLDARAHRSRIGRADPNRRRRGPFGSCRPDPRRRDGSAHRTGHMDAAQHRHRRCAHRTRGDGSPRRHHGGRGVRRRRPAIRSDIVGPVVDSLAHARDAHDAHDRAFRRLPRLLRSFHAELRPRASGP